MNFTGLQNLDGETFKEPVEEMMKSKNGDARGHDPRAREMLAKNEIFLWGDIYGDNANRGDANRHSANGDSAEAVASQVDLRLD